MMVLLDFYNIFKLPVAEWNVYIQYMPMNLLIAFLYQRLSKVLETPTTTKFNCIMHIVALSMRASVNLK